MWIEFRLCRFRFETKSWKACTEPGDLVFETTCEEMTRETEFVTVEKEP